MFIITLSAIDSPASAAFGNIAPGKNINVKTTTNRIDKIAIPMMVLRAMPFLYILKKLFNIAIILFPKPLNQKSSKC